MLGTLFEITDARLPRTLPVAVVDSYHESSIHWEKVDGKICSRGQRESLIIEKLGGYLDWPGAKYEYHVVDDTHQACVHNSADYPKEMFLESKVYQTWKNRKTRGPGLLYATGLGVSPLFFHKNLLQVEDEPLKCH